METNSRRRKIGKVAAAKSEIVAELPKACSDERAAVEFMERQRWGDSPACPRCGDTAVYAMRDRAGERSKRYLWKCRGCAKQFTVRVGTIMEDSPIPMRHWCYAFWAACSSKKGVSAKQIQRMTGLSYKSALFMMHRIRWSMAPANAAQPKLTGTVEVDETYVGGRPRKVRAYHPDGRTKSGPAPDFQDRKTPVFAAVQRDGRVKCRVVDRVTAASLKGAVRECVDPSARVMTDQATAYIGLGNEFAGGHHTVNHLRGEYSRDNGDITTNRAESFFATLKRGLHGTFHSVSRKHLHRYVSEFEFRFNNRLVDDGERTVRAIQAADGKRLTYKEQTKGS